MMDAEHVTPIPPAGLSTHSAVAEQSVPTSSPAADAELLDAYSRAVVSVVKAVEPAVVAISIGREAPTNSFEPQGAGSGFVIAPDGYVVTNSHVVASNQKIEVLITDGGRHRARLLGDDPPTDLALLRISGSGHPFLSLISCRAAASISR